MAKVAARRTLLTGGALAVAGLVIMGCASQGSSSSAPAQATSAASAAQAPPTSPAAAPATPAGCAPATPAGRAGRVWRFIIRACAGHLQLGRVLV